MAEDKKSFLLYCDLIHTIKLLSDEQAGKLFKHLLSYVNDENPILDDALLNIAFEPIKRQLKRDLDKYEDTKKERSIFGREGNLKRWHKDIYDRYKSNELSLDEAEKIAESRKVSPPDSTQSTPIANIADNDTVNVNDTVNDINNNTSDKPKINFSILLKVINEKTGRKFTVINPTVRKKYYARLKDGYTKENIFNAIVNCVNDNWHKENNYKYLTPLYFSQQKTLDTYGTELKEIKKRASYDFI